MTFEHISEYMKRCAEERKSHLDLNEPCIEIGGGSQQFRGLMAHYLKTTISTKREAVLCHACHNGACSNVKHLYWGTYSDNLRDANSNGRPSPFQMMVAKHGEEKAREMMASRAKKKLPL